MLKNFKPVRNSDTPWLCYRDPNSILVYFVHSKCACTFYKELFSKLNWQPCTTHDINWSTNQVFSYIRDPLVKQRIGIIEWFFYNSCGHLLNANSNNDAFFKLLSEISSIDHHSLSIYEHLGDNSQLVHWIPIDQPNIDHKQMTINLIEKYSTVDPEIKEWFLAQLPTNQSTGFKRQMNDRLLSLPAHPLVLKSIDYDQCLYDAVTKTAGFEPRDYQSRIEQLKATGISEIEAQQIADNEVESGKYMSWNI